MGEEIARLHGVLDAATGRSVVVINEALASTSLDDARTIGRDFLERLSALNCLCTYVTFIDELATLSDKVVSMVSTADPDDPAIRTFRVVRRAADGLAYAKALAAKYHLTSEEIRSRLAIGQPSRSDATGEVTHP